MKRLKLLSIVTAGVAAATFAHAASKVAPGELVLPISEYKIWVGEEVEALVSKSKAFTDAVRAGDLAKAQALYAPARVYYERIEPIAELFSDLDKAIDVRADDFAKKEADPKFTGFHRIEYGLFAKKSVDGLAPLADKLDSDIKELQSRIKGLTVPPEKVVGGAAALLEEVAKTKISGEEDRYSRTDLWDFNANVEGAKKIHTLLRSLTEKANPKLVTRIDANFTKVEAVLAKYALPGGGYKSYDELTKKDRNAVRGPVTALAEDLSRLRGELGLK
ncbi:MULTISPECIES: iron uptake system protein EfeO [Rhodopseudomonas]|uniref:Iron transporter n=1 Tax=Rhodopseudomonas palustris TaxID=1076 RepID=A0A0D7F6B6_RHOPL|nr:MULTISPECIES: iron uptake system protein EfeO [Rhodopseudomonas]KIZ47247.1 iron transporter [Rhodopseudomonas palustris]MDF3811569.1 iron uptake system protein EfeO [Rhodopseudomonas sp. BAL398]WOK19389.1 iron uptake system protein EfeO [Rhodopseudomonas sp. BAL398]